MKTQLHYYFVLLCTLFCFTTGYSQINYTQNFDDGPGNWIDFDGFYDTTFNACTDGSFRGNFYYYIYDGEGYDNPAETVSPSVGLSNGQLATITYNYKLMQYSDTTVPTPNSPDWGSFQFQYGSSPTGPWTTFQTVTPANHVESDACVPKTATFTPPSASMVYIRIYCATAAQETDVVLFVDDIVITQASLGCTGQPAVSATAAADTTICNQQNAELSLNPSYFTTGLAYQWQKSTDGIAYTDILGATAATLTTPQTVNTWYKARVTCVASTQFVISTPVQVTNTGLNCVCAVEYSNNVEPITNVTFASINNTTSADVNGTPDVQDFSGLTPALVYKEQSYPISLQGNTDGDYENFFKVFIDFNQNGNLNDAGESFEIGSIENSNGSDGQLAAGSITIPAAALTGVTFMRVFKLYADYPETPCGTDFEFGYGQVEDYLLNIQPCTTLAPVAETAQAFCTGATLADIDIAGTVVKWYAGETGGTALGGNLPLVDGAIYYASQTLGCESITRTPVTVTINTVEADAPENVVTCSGYVLPELTNGAYYTEAGGLGDMIAAGTVVSGNTTLYVYNMVGACSAENSFTITIDNFEVDQLEDVTVCSEYVLPELTSGTYYTGGSGLGDMLEPGDVINETITLHVYGVSQDNPACTADTSFTVTVINVEADELEDVSVCSEYVLPELSVGNNYYTGSGMVGTMLSAGDVITADMIIYIYTEVGDATTCSDETSFTVTIEEVFAPTGDDSFEFVIDDLTDYYFLYQAEIEALGVITWYETEEDALNGENALPEDFILPIGTNTYYVTQTIGECESEPFEVTITVTTLAGAGNFDMAAFSFYPNPVTDVLNLSYSENITGVQVVNLLGQQIMSGTFNQDKVQLDLSQLASGTYLVKVQTENASKIIKVVKNK